MKMKFKISTGAAIVQIIAILLLVVAIIVPEWLQNPAGLNNYPLRRTWGLFSVIGKSSMSHRFLMDQMCLIASEMSIGLLCTTPLCDWYASKCNGYRIVLIISTVSYSVLFLALVMVVGTIFCSFRPTKKTLRFASGFSFIAIFLTVGVLFAYIFVMDMAFGVLNAAGFYPMPQPGVSFILACLSAFFQLVGLIIHCYRLRRHIRESEYIEDVAFEREALMEEYAA